MKKLCIALLMAGCAGGILTAQAPLELSVGAGGNFNVNFTSYFLSSDVSSDYNPNTHMIGGGGYVFFDATYVEANVGVLFGNANADKLPDGVSDEVKKGTGVTALKLGLFGKYPIRGQGFTFFPMLGIDGQINLGGTQYGEEVPSDYREKFNKLYTFIWFKAGAGADFPLGGQLYIRPEALYGIRLNTEGEKDALDVSDYTKAIMGHGLDIRLAIGYRFF